MYQDFPSSKITLTVTKTIAPQRPYSKNRPLEILPLRKKLPEKDFELFSQVIRQ
jgi:hypothetical protein